MTEAIGRAAGSGRALFIVEQNLNLIEEAANRVYLLDHGRCAFEAPNGPGLRAALLERLRL